MNKHMDPKAWIRENQEAIMSYFLGAEITSRLIRSPFRHDENPTCGFYYGRTGCLYLHDFATDEHLDCIEIVKKLYSLNYIKAIQLIFIESDKYGIAENKLHESKNIEYVAGKDDFSYFLKLGIKLETLKKYNVKTARALYIDEDLYWRATDKNPIFIYQFPSGRFKAYRPLSPDKKKKWKSNCTIQDILGFTQLPKKGKIVIITSSLKDAMVLHEIGYSAIAFNSEGIPTRNENGKFVENTINHLRERFDNVLLFLDNDEPGINYAKKVSERFNITSITIPSNLPKDISDVVAKHNLKKARKLVNKLVRKAISTDSVFDDFVSSTSIKTNIFDERNNEEVNK